MSRFANKTRLALESLEDRCLPSATALPWPDAQHLTISFAPDGTDIAGSESALYRILDSVAATQTWQTEMLRAFQTWVIHGNVNVGLVADSGEAFGTAGALQGDSRFGDIRIGTYPLSSEVVAVASPFDFLAGTWSGDVKLSEAFVEQGYALADLFSVMLHEAGHSFGLSHNDDPNSVMYEHLAGHTQLSPEDIAAFQELYGSRQADEFDSRRSNDTMADAALLSKTSVLGDLTTEDDVDWYSFHVQGKETDIRVGLKMSGFSLLSARLSVFDGDGRLIGTAESSGPLDGDLEVQFTRTAASVRDYYVKVEKARDDVFGIGAYELQVSTQAAPSKPTTPSAPGRTDDNDTLQSAVNLLAKTARTDLRFDYFTEGVLEDAGDVDYYRFKSPSAHPDGSTMTVIVWSSDGNNWRPVVDLYDAKGNPVQAELLVNDNGTYVLQLPDPQANDFYYAGVRQRAASAAESVSYSLGIDFSTRHVELTKLAGLVPIGLVANQELGVLHVVQSQLFHFVIEPQQFTAHEGLWFLVVSDSNGFVSRIPFSPDEARSFSLYLTQGDYRFEIDAPSNGGSGLLALSGIGLTNPVGPEAVDPTLSAIGANISASFSAWWEFSTGFLAGLSSAPATQSAEAPTPSGSFASPTKTVTNDLVESGNTRLPADGILAQKVVSSILQLSSPSAALNHDPTSGGMLPTGSIMLAPIANAPKVVQPKLLDESPSATNSKKLPIARLPTSGTSNTKSEDADPSIIITEWWSRLTGLGDWAWWLRWPELKIVPAEPVHQSGQSDKGGIAEQRAEASGQLAAVPPAQREDAYSSNQSLVEPDRAQARSPVVNVWLTIPRLLYLFWAMTLGFASLPFFRRLWGRSTNRDETGSPSDTSFSGTNGSPVKRRR
ncbi:MAG: hypothetical protein KatS3mg105_3026 [Gemmatales bacterium]|nr:MAG: hypothetical protein KatS3mg105_3026 [Gemmatales bacterium]